MPPDLPQNNVGKAEWPVGQDAGEGGVDGGTAVRRQRSLFAITCSLVTPSGKRFPGSPVVTNPLRR